MIELSHIRFTYPHSDFLLEIPETQIPEGGKAALIGPSGFGKTTLLILGLIVSLSLRLRKEEIFTMFTIGSSWNKTLEILDIELLLLVGMSLAVAGLLYSFTGLFVEGFIRKFII